MNVRGSCRHGMAAAWCLAITVCTAGCAVQEKHITSPAPVPQQFSKTGTAPLPRQWWRAFDDPGLNTAIDLALRDNFDLQTAWDRLTQARAIARREGANLWPSVDGSAGAARSVTDTHGQRIYQSDLSLGLTVNYELDVWGRIRSARDAAVCDAQATEQDLHAAAITLSATVAQTWYRWAEQQAQVRLIQEQIETNQKVLEVLTLQFKQGKAQAADVLRQRQLVQQTQGQLTLAQGRAQVTRHLLAVLLGRPPQAELPLPQPALVKVPDLPATGLPSALLRRRPDLLSAEQTIRAADERLASAIADQYPRISLSAAATASAARVRDLFDNWLVNLAGNLAQPLFDGGQRRAEVQRNRAVVSQALNEYGAAILTALQEVEDALSEESHQQRYLQSLTQQLDTSTQVYERTKDSYLNGQLDYIRVLEALTSRQTLQRERITARRERIDKRIDLCRAVAGSWELAAPAPRTLKVTTTNTPEDPSRLP